MPNKTRSVPLGGVLALLCGSLLYGCASPTAASLVADYKPRRGPIEKTVRVAAITSVPMGTRDWAWGCFWNLDELRTSIGDALAQTVIRSRLFRAASTDGAADLELQVEVRSHKVWATGFFSSAASVKMDYRAVETATGRAVWTTAVRSESGSSGPGGTRMTRACEVAIRANFERALDELSKSLEGAKR